MDLKETDIPLLSDFKVQPSPSTALSKVSFMLFDTNPQKEKQIGAKKHHYSLLAATPATELHLYQSLAFPFKVT